MTPGPAAGSAAVAGAAAALAAQSLGASTTAVIAWAARTVAEMGPVGTLVDAGCGQLDLAAALAAAGRRPERYIGLDAVAYAGLAERPWVEFRSADLNCAPFPCPEGEADVVASVETIEHLENPRAFVRELARMARSGGRVLVTTPNQASWLSKLSLLLKDEFHAFQERPGLYPTHITALLPVDLERIGRECGLHRLELRYSGAGRMPGSARPYPTWISRRRAQGASDNVMLLGEKP